MKCFLTCHSRASSSAVFFLVMTVATGLCAGQGTTARTSPTSPFGTPTGATSSTTGTTATTSPAGTALTPAAPAPVAPAPSPAPAPTPIAAAGSTAVGDGLWFDSFPLQYSLVDSQVSADENWVCTFTGYGEVRTEAIGNNTVMKLSPRSATSPDRTHASLAFTRASFGDQLITMDVRTVQQLRQGSAPNVWECAWVAFRAADPANFYYFILKPNGIELGKLHGVTQYFLYTADSPKLTLGKWSHWTIKVVGNRIVISVDGVQVVDFTDQNALPVLRSGAVGLYTEDAYVQFDNVRIVPLESIGSR